MQLRKESLKKIQACTGFEPFDLCDTGAALLPIEPTANWEQVVELARYKPVKG